jgi:hypothetical protein
LRGLPAREPREAECSSRGEGSGKFPLHKGLWIDELAIGQQGDLCTPQVGGSDGTTAGPLALARVDVRHYWRGSSALS